MAWDTPSWRLRNSGTNAYIYVSADSYWHKATEDALLHILGDDETTVHDLGTPSALRTLSGLVRGQNEMDRFINMVGKNCTLTGPYDSAVDVRLMQVSKPRSVEHVADLATRYWQISLELMKR